MALDELVTVNLPHHVVEDRGSPRRNGSGRRLMVVSADRCEGEQEERQDSIV